MSKDSNAILKAVADIVAQKAPEIISEALVELADNTEDSLAAAFIGIAATWVTLQGEESIGLVGDHLQNLIDGDPMAIAELSLGGISAAELSRITSELQSAEAERVVRLSRLAKAIGATLADVGSLLSEAILIALKAV